MHFSEVVSNVRIVLQNLFFTSANHLNAPLSLFSVHSLSTKTSITKSFAKIDTHKFSVCNTICNVNSIGPVDVHNRPWY